MAFRRHIFRDLTAWLLGLSLLLLPAVAAAEKLRKRNYDRLAAEMGVVLLDVNWGRRWNCADYENAQLVSLNFESISRQSGDSDRYTVIRLQSPSRLFVDAAFLNYGFLVEPGTYAFTEWSVKTAKSASDVGYKKAGRKELVDNGGYHGGTFKVGAGEVIYIGNFYLDCYYSPIPWRFYTEGASDFDAHVRQYKAKYGFLQDATVEFRLLETKNYGTSYALPDESDLMYKPEL
jgi:hypothetical protein